MEKLIFHEFFFLFFFLSKKYPLFSIFQRAQRRIPRFEGKNIERLKVEGREE